jgi:hypothetical protein
MAQEMSTSLGPFFAFLIVRCWIRCLRLPFLSCPHSPPHCAPPPPFSSCCVVVRPRPLPVRRPVLIALVVVLWLSPFSCGGCSPHRLPHCRSSSAGASRCRCLSPRYRSRPVPLSSSTWFRFFFVISPPCLSRASSSFPPREQLLPAVLVDVVVFASLSTPVPAPLSLSPAIVPFFRCPDHLSTP